MVAPTFIPPTPLGTPFPHPLPCRSLAPLRAPLPYIPNPTFHRRHHAASPRMSTLPPTRPILPSAAPPSTFHLSRAVTFALMSLTYATYVSLRATFTYVSPPLSAALGLPLSAVGQIASAFPLAYAFSRLFTGALVDRSRPHVALSIGLVLAGVTNLAMSSVSSASLLALFWGLNGLVQGVGAGSSAKILTAWFSRKERGLFWALWSTSANLGAFCAPILCAALAATSWGFRAGLFVPGAFAVCFGLMVMPVMSSSPKDARVSPPWHEDEDEKTDQGGKDVEKMAWRKAFVEGVLKNRVIWGLAVAYFFVYLVRNGMKSWLHFWLLEVRKVGAAEAAYRVSGMEVGGIVGTFSAGIVSDVADGRRVVVTICYLVGVVAALLMAWWMPAGGAVRDFAVMSVLGFMINGPQMMIGLIGAEASSKRVVATATGVLGWISYLGAATSGFPLSIVIRKWGWGGYFAALVGSTVCSVACLAPFWKFRGESSA